jgi:hypothetical protein
VDTFIARFTTDHSPLTRLPFLASPLLQFNLEDELQPLRERNSWQRRRFVELVVVPHRRVPPAPPIPIPDPGPKPEPEPGPGSAPDLVPPMGPEPEPELPPDVFPPVPEPSPI